MQIDKEISRDLKLNNIMGHRGNTHIMMMMMIDQGHGHENSEMILIK